MTIDFGGEATHVFRKTKKQGQNQPFSEDYMVAHWQRVCRVLRKAAVTR